MNDAILNVLERKSVAPLVRFERRPVEDKPASVSQGRTIMKDVDYAIITPPYSKDEVYKKVEQFLGDLDRKVSAGTLMPEQADRYRRQHDAWKNGQEMPLSGTPIRGWPMLTPAQQENLIHVNIPTVEYLAEVNDEGLRHIGMGALEQKRKAVAWLAQATDKGPLTQQMAAIQTENDLLKISLAKLTEQVQALLAYQTLSTQATMIDSLAAHELLGEEPAEAPVSPRRRGPR